MTKNPNLSLENTESICDSQNFNNYNEFSIDDLKLEHQKLFLKLKNVKTREEKKTILQDLISICSILKSRVKWNPKYWQRELMKYKEILSVL